MTSDLFGLSPMSTLNTSIRGGLAAGQLGVVMARPGVGKSAFLVHVALGHLVRDTEVLHISLEHPVAHVRSFYDEILHEMVRASGRSEATSAKVEVERNRVIHSFLNGPFTTELLTHLLATLEEVMHFAPTVIVIDGSGDAADVDTAAWKKMAQDGHIRIWLAVNTHDAHGPSAEETAQGFDTAVVLEPNGSTVELQVLRAGGQAGTESAHLQLNPVTLLAEGENHQGTPLAPSPAPQTVTLVSGGATGAECAFGAAAEKWGLTEVNLTFEGHIQERENGSKLLSPKELQQGEVSMAYVNQRLKRSWDRNGPVAKILQTQWHLVSQVRQLFVVGAIQDDGTVTGGTGWSGELGRRWGKTMWVFCQEREQWYCWSGNDWVTGEPVIESARIGGTGTRFVTDAGKRAIADLFERSFGQ